MKQIKQVDLFSGIGGFRLATESVANSLNIPFKSIGFSEIDKFATQAYKAFYNTTKEEEIGDIISFCGEKKRIEELPDFNLLTGGFPCQPFSMMGAKKGFADSRGGLFFEILKIIDLKKPDIVLLENVKNIKTHDNGKTLCRICELLGEHGYPSVTYDVFNTSDFGLPQTRNRVYILALREKPKDFVFRSKVVKAYYDELKSKGIREYNSVLDILEADVDEKYYLSERIKPTILANGGGNFISKSEINKIIARPLVATMGKMHRACQDNYYSDIFIKTRGNKNDSSEPIESLVKKRIRKLTPNEAFLLQGFPREFAQIASKNGISNAQLYKQAGNAVSVNVPYAIMLYLMHLNKSIN
jgi:DNA (cytosine-5)-methyltransferase 1